jgi:hypothetical protein
MSRHRVIGGMFGLKLVSHYHFKFDFFNRNGKPALMNFPDSPEGRRIAPLVRIGHRSLVYLMTPRAEDGVPDPLGMSKHIGAAIEYVHENPKLNLLDDGMEAANKQKAVAYHETMGFAHWARLFRCIRIVAWIDDPRNGPIQDFQFSKGDTMFDITKEYYDELYNQIPSTDEA